MTSVRLKRVARVIAGQSPLSDDVSALASGQPFIQGNAEFGRDHPIAKFECMSAPKVAELGDVLISVRAPVGAVNVADQRYGIGRGLASVRAAAIDAGYLRWLLEDSNGVLRSAATGSTFEAVSAADVGALVVPVGDIAHQRHIRAFLDRETATIDALIEKQQALIDGLGRRRGVAISQAVDAESLAALPGPRLRHAVAEVRQGWSPQCNNWPAEGNDWAVLKAGCVNGGLFRPGENKQLPDSLEPRPETVVRREELVVSRANTRELVGSAAVVQDASPRLMLSDKLYALTLREEVNPDFVAFALGTRRYRDLIELEATGASYSMQNISQRVILDLPFCVPSRAEQDAAVVEIRALVAELDQLVSKAERFIELAKERRAALITAAVTGQLDVATGKVA